MKFFFMYGSGGQLLIVFPDPSLVVVFTAGDYETHPRDTHDPILRKSILPALVR